MIKHRIFSIFLVVILVLLGWFVYVSEFPGNPFSKFPFRYGLDLSGGTELTYRADVSKVASSEIENRMMVLRDVIERRINAFGVAEAIIHIEEAGVVSGNADHRLVVELPGVTDTQKAIDIIGKTPSLEFKLLPYTISELVTKLGSSTLSDHPELFESTGLTGGLLQNSQIEFTSDAVGISGQPIVSLQFNEEGKDLFAKITRENTGKVLGIFLDGELISAPTIDEEIPNGSAVIRGNFTPDEAKTLVRNLNYGALPIPINLASTQIVGASLGEQAKELGVRAGLWGFLLVAIFLLVLYRLPGLVATIGLLLYIAISLSIFKLIPVTLTAAGIAGFIISIGMAIDANVLIFERMKDELRSGKSLSDAVQEGFSRAWLPVRDANLSGIITAVILFWLGNATVKGFALTLGIGSIVSMFTATTVVRTLLVAVAGKGSSEGKLKRFLFGGKKKSV